MPPLPARSAVKASLDVCSSAPMRRRSRSSHGPFAWAPPPARALPEGLTRDRSKLCAMVSSEVQRTLVKSPPELWAEISDPESLARHLGEFGEIRITRVHPEQRVEWETDDARGTRRDQAVGLGHEGQADGHARAAGGRRAGDAARAVSEPVAQPEPAADAETQPAAGFEAEQQLAAGARGRRRRQRAGEDRRQPTARLPNTSQGTSRRRTCWARTMSRPSAPRPAPPTRLRQKRPRTRDRPDGRRKPAAGRVGIGAITNRCAEPRRGFFARLFGRRRSATRAPREAGEARPLPSEQDEATAPAQRLDGRARRDAVRRARDRRADARAASAREHRTARGRTAQRACAQGARGRACHASRRIERGRGRALRRAARAPRDGRRSARRACRR